MSWQDNDLNKGRSHKYIKRTGTPGDYKYWYYDPASGQLKEGDDQEHGKKDHARRLLASRAAGHHAMDNGKIASEVGISAKRLREHISNLTQAGRRKNPTAENHLAHGHDYEEHHLHEGHKDLAHADYAGHVEASKREAAGGEATAPRRQTAAPTPTERHEIPAETPAPRRRAARPAPSEPSRAEAHAVTDAEKTELRFAGFMKQTDGSFLKHHTGGTVHIKKDKIDGKWSVTSAGSDGSEAGGPGHDDLGAAISSAEEHGEAIESSHSRRREEQAREEAPTPAPRARRPRAPAATTSEREQEGRAIAATTPVTPTGPSAEALARARARVGIPRAEAASRATESVERVAAARQAMETSAPSAPAAVAAHAASPELAATDAPIQRMIEAQAAGKNPYVTRAKEIFERIKADVEPARRGVVSHMMTALSAVQNASGGVNKATWKAKYKELSGDGEFAEAIKHFESATFMDAKEILDNEPINPEIERMKRGFGAKQYARLKPFLNQAYMARAPDGPPPYPTFNDLKSWADHGSPRPASMSWTTPTGRAGGVSRAMPEEFFHSMPKNSKGEAMMPPPTIPLNLTPAWIYLVKSSQQKGDDPYNSPLPATNAAGGYELDNQGQLGGHMVNSLRRFIQMRGENNFVDIPKSKLAEKGLSHHDIYKSDSDNFLTTKIIDPVALIGFMKQEKASMKKSWALVVDLDLPAQDLRKSYVVRSNMQKSKIERVRELIREKSRS